jgi:hypothetical protein
LRLTLGIKIERSTYRRRFHIEGLSDFKDVKPREAKNLDRPLHGTFTCIKSRSIFEKTEFKKGKIRNKNLTSGSYSPGKFRLRSVPKI